MKAEEEAKQRRLKVSLAVQGVPYIGPTISSMLSPDPLASAVRDGGMAVLDAPSQGAVAASDLERGQVLLTPEMRHRMMLEGRDPNEVARVPRQSEDGLDIYDSPVSAAYKIGRDVLGGHFNESAAQQRHRFLAEQAGMDPALMGERSANLQAGAVPLNGRQATPVDMATRVQEMLSSESAKREVAPATQAIQGSEVAPPNVYTALSEAGVDPVNAGLAYLASDAWNLAFEAPSIARGVQRGLTGLTEKALAKEMRNAALPSTDAADAAIRNLQSQRPAYLDTTARVGDKPPVMPGKTARAPRVEEVHAANAAEAQQAAKSAAEAVPGPAFEPREFKMKRSYAEAIGAQKGDKLRLEAVDGEDYVAKLVRPDGTTEEFRVPRADMDDDLAKQASSLKEVKPKAEPKPAKPAPTVEQIQAADAQAAERAIAQGESAPVAVEPEVAAPVVAEATPNPAEISSSSPIAAQRAILEQKMAARRAAASDAVVAKTDDSLADAARAVQAEPAAPAPKGARTAIPDGVSSKEAKFVNVGGVEAGIAPNKKRGGYTAWDGEHVAHGSTTQKTANALSAARKRSATLGETRAPQLPNQATQVGNKPVEATPGGDKSLVRDFINKKVDRAAAQHGAVTRPGGKGVTPGTVDDAQFSYGAGGVHPTTPGLATPGPNGPLNVAEQAAKSPHETLRGLARKMTRLVFGEDKTLAQTGAAGYYRKTANVAALRKAYNMPDGFHEMGHALDAKLGMQQRLSPTAQQELHGLVQNAANYTPAQMGDEGLAEAVRLFIHDPAELMRKAPSVAHELEAAVQGDKQIADILGEAQHEVAQFRNTLPEGRIQAVTTPKAKYKAKPGIVQKAQAVGDKTIEKVFDQLVHIERGEEAALGTKAALKDSAYKQGRVFRATGNEALHTSLHGEGMPTITRDAAGAIVRTNNVIVVNGEKYRNLGDILKGLNGEEAVQDFETYLVARRAQELGAGKSPVDLHDADAAIRNYEAKYGQQDLQNRAKAFYKWHDSVLQYAVDSGLVGEKSAKNMRELYSNYVPFRRNNDIGVDEYAVQQFADTNRGLEAGKPSSLMKLNGSHREIVSPLQTSIANAHAIYINGEKNLVGQTMARNIDRLGPRSGEALGTNVTVRKLQNIGGKTISVTAAPHDAQNVIKVLFDGKAEYYKLKPEVFTSWKHISTDEMGTIGKMLQPASKVVRFGVTNNPKFIYNEFIRNPIEYAIVSESVKVPIALPVLNEPFVRGVASYLMAGLEHSGANRTAAGKVANHILSYLGSADGVKLYKQYGGKAGINAALGDEAHYASELSKITQGLTPQELKNTWLPKGFASRVKAARQKIGLKRRFMAFKESSEDVARVGVFEAAKRQGLKKGKSVAEANAEAAFEARDVLDFSQKGSAMKELSAIQAFTRPKLTGTHRFYRAVKRDPVGTLIKSITSLIVPAMLVYAKHRNDADYQEINSAEKRYFWHWRYGDGPKDFFRVAKPPGIATVYFDELVQRALEHADHQDPKAFEGVFDSLLESQTPFQTQFPFVKLGSLVDAGQILQMNYDPFYKGPVLQPYELNKLPSDAISDKTPMLSEKLSNVPGDIAEKFGGDRRKYDGAPKAVDRAVQSVLPGLLYEGYRRVGGTPAGVSNSASDLVGLTKHDFSSQTLNDLYKRQAFLRDVKGSDKFQAGEEQELRDIEAVMSTVNELKGQLKTATDKTQRDAIIKKIFAEVKPFQHKVK